MPEPASPPADPPANPDPPAADPPAEPRTFSEEQVNRIVQERLSRDRKDRPSDEEIASLREKAQKHDEIEAANATELEKAQKAAADAEAAKVAAEERASKTLIRAAVISEAAKQNAVDPDAVVALLPADALKIEDGEVTGAEDAVKALLESKPYLANQADPPTPGGGGPRDPVPPKDLDAQIAEAEKAGDVNLAISLKSQKLHALAEAA